MGNNDFNLSALLPTIREYVISTLEKNESRSLYTNVSRLFRLEKFTKQITEEEVLTENEQAHLKLLLYTDLIHNAKVRLTSFDMDLSVKHAVKVANKLAKKFELPPEVLKRLIEGIQQTLPGKVSTIPEAKVMHDAIMMDFSGHRGRDNLKLLYEEMLLRDVELPKNNWYEILIGIIEGREALTKYGQKHIQPEVEKLNRQLKKEKKEIEHKTSLLLKKELNISEVELKKLRKDINIAAGRDEKGIQTLFRTTIKNHYTLNEMVDRKASIMITVNSIILSIVMSGAVGYDFNLSIQAVPNILIGVTCISSIIFAIIAIIPTKTQGDFSEEEIRNKEGNLLYFGNFHNMHLRDFEWGFLQLLNDKEYLYGSMIRDYYFQGIGLNRKYKFIRISLTFFLIGFGLSFLIFLISNLILK